MDKKQIIMSLGLVCVLAMTGVTIKAQNTETDNAALNKSEREELEKLRKEKRDEGVWRTRYVNVGYVSQTLTSPADEAESEWGVGYNVYRSAFLHKTPIGGVAKIGIDFGCTADFVKFKSDRTFDFGFKEEIVNKLLKTDRVNDMFQVDALLAVGPSVKVAPFGFVDNFLNKINASAYWHLNAGVSLLKFSTDEGYFKDVAMPALSLGNTIGLRLSLNRLTVGYERRLTSGKYWCKYDMDVYVNGSYDSYHSYDGEEKIKFKSTTNSIFIGINF